MVSMSNYRLAPYYHQEQFPLLRPIDGRTIALLGKEMGRDWYLCGIYLGIRNASLQSIQDRNTRSLETMSVEMLEQWKKMKGDCASSEELHDAFVKLGRRDLAEMLETDPPLRERCNALDKREVQPPRQTLRKSCTAGCHRKGNLSKSTSATASNDRKSRDDSYLDEASEQWDIVRAHHTVEYQAVQQPINRSSTVSLHPVNIFPGYYEFLSREQGTRKLYRAKDGTYLIRQRLPKSQEEKFHRHTLMVIVQGEISNIRILMKEDQRLYLESSELPIYFKTLFELVEWHKTNSFIDVSDKGCHRVKLIRPVE